ncbi:hypothetical protein HETIRDRAFT_327118 [Heterobasidion irregulare TC 32-1]|uniref:Uncharacterized protein n=1 Tax=Heterobasidion irregulare (strain TC 32-1) TaxID=747525 RepID=W4JW67_HETIT|nr:uncharacterized protein HETIRDRAFT_327118 [Heterobasidion irregulare TC 32-1]ETW77136.1 hypothetical protein HETIRDRAFT_327118 [Heterobasidion irregulare TC 32-1]
MQFKEGDNGEHVSALQNIGKTRFGTHWSGAYLLEMSLPQVRHLVQSGTIKLKHKKVQNLFAYWVSKDYHRLELGLLQYIMIIQPLIRSLWALKSMQANASDVYVFYLAMGAALRELFNLGQQKTGIILELAEEVMGIINECFDTFFEDCKDFHVTAFTLDPHLCLFPDSTEWILMSHLFLVTGYPWSDFLINSAAANPVIVISEWGSDLNIPHPCLFNHMKAFLWDEMFKPMVERMDTHLEGTHPVLKRLGGAMAITKFWLQLDAYWQEKAPFDRAKPIQDGDVLGWWWQFTNDPEAVVLAMLAERVFSILVNSMLDEWTGSRFTWFNSALRGCQCTQLLMDMTIIGQWYSTQATKDKVPKKRLTVKFCDLEDDLKAAVSRSSPEGTADMADTATLDGSDSDDDSDDSDDDTDGQQRGPPCWDSALNIVQEFAIREEAFVDLLSDTPRYTATSPPPPPPPPEAPPSIPSSEIDWSW